MAVFSFTYSDSEIIILGPKFGGFSAAKTPLPKGMVQAGRINDPVGFGKLLGQALMNGKPEPIRAKHVVIGLPEKQAFIKTICLPKKLKRPEVEKALEYQWQTILPIPPDLAYYDFDIIKPIRKPLKTDTTQQILIVAYPTEIINTLITICKNLGLTPVKIVPASFGLAELFTGKEPSATMLVESTTGYDIPVTIAQRGATRFSTIVHNQVNNPASVKQVDNIRSFYERNIGINGELIKKLIILPGPYTALLGQALASLKLQTEVVAAEKFFKGTPIDPQQASRWVYLVGLLRSKTRLTILPTSLLEANQAMKQYGSFRLLTIIVGTSFVVALYFSLIFWGSVRLEKNNQSQYSQKFIDFLSTENIQTTDAINTLNQQMVTLPLDTVKKRNMSKQFEEISKLTVDIPDLGTTQIIIDNERNVIQIVGKPKDQGAVSSLTDKLKAYRAGATVDMSPPGVMPDGQTEIIITLTGGAL